MPGKNDGVLTLHIPLTKLSRICNPYRFNVWRGLDSPITSEEVQAVIDGPRPLLRKFDYDARPGEGASVREYHVGRVAYLITYGWEYPIEVDVDCVIEVRPDSNIIWPVNDGNHRLAAAIFKGDKTILASLAGSPQRMHSLGLIRNSRYLKMGG